MIGQRCALPQASWLYPEGKWHASGKKQLDRKSSISFAKVGVQGKAFLSFDEIFVFRTSDPGHPWTFPIYPGGIWWFGEDAPGLRGTRNWMKFWGGFSPWPPRMNHTPRLVRSLQFGIILMQLHSNDTRLSRCHWDFEPWKTHRIHNCA